MKIDTLKKHKTFGGETVFCVHPSRVTGTNMKFSYFLPKKGVDKAILWLSGLTCTEENFMTKAGAQKYLKDTKTMIVCPDTSPRGLNLKGEHDSYDFGSGAGFYLNATSEGYANHYRMYDYIISEFIPMIKEHFNFNEMSISGHSMGGHGALVFGLRNPELFTAISAFSPIVNPTAVPWGVKAFEGYLGKDQNAWKDYDATELILSGNKHPKIILIEQGLGDEFYEEQLKTQIFEKACEQHEQPLKVNYQEGYDHSYYFVSSFIEAHLNHLG